MPPRPGLRRVLLLVAEAQADLVDALADDGQIDVTEAASIAIQLLGHIAQPACGVGGSARAAAWRDMRAAIRRGNREQAHAALDRALGWA